MTSRLVSWKEKNLSTLGAVASILYEVSSAKVGRTYFDFGVSLDRSVLKLLLHILNGAGYDQGNERAAGSLFLHVKRKAATGKHAQRRFCLVCRAILVWICLPGLPVMSI